MVVVCVPIVYVVPPKMTSAWPAGALLEPPLEVVVTPVIESVRVLLGDELISLFELVAVPLADWSGLLL
jgi:hypothetical protein